MATSCGLQSSGGGSISGFPALLRVELAGGDPTPVGDSDRTTVACRSERFLSLFMCASRTASCAIEIVCSRAFDSWTPASFVHMLLRRCFFRCRDSFNAWQRKFRPWQRKVRGLVPRPERADNSWMASSSKLVANRRNAQFSTGPKTVEGKAASSRNALRHGLLSGQVVLPDESAAEFDEFCNRITTDRSPVGEIEAILVERI